MSEGSKVDYAIVPCHYRRHRTPRVRVRSTRPGVRQPPSMPTGPWWAARTGRPGVRRRRGSGDPGVGPDRV